ncbi:hypothetical protein LTR95_010955 [Oleoguttula sp. CCFEE 5521]
MQAMAPDTPLEAGGEMFSRPKTQSIFLPRSSSARPLSEATEIFDTDLDTDSEFEEEKDQMQSPPSPKGSFDSDDSRRRSQTTISSYEEAPTPSSTSSRRRPHELQLQSTQGPRGPHLFRASQASADAVFDHALQMSPLFPKQIPPRTETAFSQQTVTPITQQQQFGFSIDAVMNRSLSDPTDAEGEIRRWNPTQVIDWMVDSGMEESIIECFELHDISGNVLMDLQFDDLKELGIQSFGKRHQLWSAISTLQGRDGSVSPIATPFQDISRPCTSNTRRSPSRGRDVCETPIDGDQTPTECGGKKRRGRKMPKALDVITPMESVSIVAIEQLLPKPHKCAKGVRCAKFRKQQRELQQLQEEHGIGRFPISPTKGGRIFVHGDPGNAWTADNLIPGEVRRLNEQPHDETRPQSEAVPSVVASSDALGPSQLPAFMLHQDMLDRLDKRDPQDNVKQFLSFQHVQTPSPPIEEHYLDGTLTPVERPATTPPQDILPLFPEEHVPCYPYQVQPSLHVPDYTQNPHQQLKSLPKLAIPRSASAAPDLHHLRSPDTACATLRSATASPGGIYRLGTPASEMDVPVTAYSNGPITRDASQSVPPGMQFREPQQISRSASRAQHWHRPSFALPAVQENEPLSPSAAAPRPSLSSTRTGSSTGSSTLSNKPRDPAHHSPNVQQFGYGADCSHAGWMRKRKTKMLRHEWTDAHFRLNGTQLAMHSNARLNASTLDTIDVDRYAVACSTAPSSSKLSAAFKSFNIKSSDASAKQQADAAAFAFQLVPTREAGIAAQKAASSGKTHHFAVKTKDERIDWMRELMLAKALQQKGKGYEVEIYGDRV